MAVMIIGGGRLGSFLAGLMEEKNEKVILLEIERGKIEKIERDLQNSIIIPGDGSNPDVLKKAGILEAQTVVACTGHDEDNLIVCQLAKFQFGVPRVISRINNPKNEWLFTRDMGVDAAVSGARMLAKLMEEETGLSHITTVLNLAAGEISIIRSIIEKNSIAAHKPIKELKFPKDCVIMTIVRENKVLLPSGKTILLPGDEILSVVADKSREEFKKILNGE